MSQIKLQSNASGTGTLTIAAPNTNSDRTLTLPDTTGTVLNDASSLAAALLTGNVDVARLVSAFSGSNVSLATNGYQKLPSGLIIQWGSFTPVGGNQTINLPITFPSSFFASIATISPDSAIVTTYGFVATNKVSNSQFQTVTRNNAGSASGIKVDWVAIGH